MGKGCLMHCTKQIITRLSFPKRQIFYFSRLKQFADDNFKFDENGRKFAKRVEDSVEKIACYKQFLLFKNSCSGHLTFPKQALAFTCLQYKSFENTVGKGEIAHNEQFLLFPLCFLPVWITSYHFHQKNCCLQTLSVWKGLKFVVWERVKKKALLGKGY